MNQEQKNSHLHLFFSAGDLWMFREFVSGKKQAGAELNKIEILTFIKKHPKLFCL